MTNNSINADEHGAHIHGDASSVARMLGLILYAIDDIFPSHTILENAWRHKRDLEKSRPVHIDPLGLGALARKIEEEQKQNE